MNNGQLRANIQSALNGIPENSYLGELLNRCYAALGEQADNGQTFMGEPVISDIGEVSRDAMKRLFRALNCSGTVAHTDLVDMACEKLGEQASAPAGYVMVPVELIDIFPEINPNNYSHDEVCDLSAWGCDLVLAAIPASPKAEPVQEPVAVMHSDGSVMSKADCGVVFDACCRTQTPLYAAPQPVSDDVASVPDERQYPSMSFYPDGREYAAACGEVTGWNACRKATLAAAPPPVAQDGWIPVSEWLPESATDVLVYGINHGSRSYTVAGLFSGSWASQETEETTRFEPTHWRPLPSAPKGGE